MWLVSLVHKHKDMNNQRKYGGPNQTKHIWGKKKNKYHTIHYL